MGTQAPCTLSHFSTLRGKIDGDLAAANVPDGLLKPSEFWTNFEKCQMRATPNGPNTSNTVLKSTINVEIVLCLIPDNAMDAAITDQMKTLSSLITTQPHQEVCHCTIRSGDITNHAKLLEECVVGGFSGMTSHPLWKTSLSLAKTILLKFSSMIKSKPS